MEMPNVMDVQIVVFPETKVAAVEHRGSPELEHETAKRRTCGRISDLLSLRECRAGGEGARHDHRRVPATEGMSDHSTSRSFAANAAGSLFGDHALAAKPPWSPGKTTGSTPSSVANA